MLWLGAQAAFNCRLDGDCKALQLIGSDWVIFIAQP